MNKTIHTMTWSELEEFTHEFEWRFDEIQASSVDLKTLSDLYSFTNFFVYDCQNNEAHSAFRPTALAIRTGVKNLWKSAEAHGVVSLDKYNILISSLIDAFEEIDEHYQLLIRHTLNHLDRPNGPGGQRSVDLVEFTQIAEKLTSTITRIEQLLDEKLTPILESMQSNHLLTDAIPEFNSTFSENNYDPKTTITSLLEQHQLPNDIVRCLFVPTEDNTRNPDIDYKVNSGLHATRPIIRERGEPPTYYNIGGNNNDGRLLRFFRIIEISVDHELRDKEFRLLKNAYRQEYKYILATSRYDVRILQKLEVEADLQLEKLHKSKPSARKSKRIRNAYERNSSLKSRLFEDRDKRVAKTTTHQLRNGNEALYSKFYPNENSSKDTVTAGYPEVFFLSYPDLVKHLDSLSITVEISDLLYVIEGSMLSVNSISKETATEVRASDDKCTSEQPPIPISVDHCIKKTPLRMLASMVVMFFGVILCATSTVAFFIMGIGVTVSDDLSRSSSTYFGITLFLVLAWLGYKLANSGKSAAKKSIPESV